MNDYWCGVIVGLSCSLILGAIGGICLSAKYDEMNKQILVLSERQKKIELWYEENKTVMKTYKFFNESWAAILEKRQNEDEEN